MVKFLPDMAINMRMGIKPTIRAVGYSLGHLAYLPRLNARSKQLGFCLDIARRIVRGSNLPARFGENNELTHVALGRAIETGVEAGKLILKDASLEISPEEFFALLPSLLPKGVDYPSPLVVSDINKLRLFAPASKSLAGRLWDPFIPVQSARAWQIAVEEEASGKREGVLTRQNQQLQRENAKLRTERGSERGAYGKIIEAALGYSADQGLEDGIQRSFDVVARLAWKIIGQHPKSQSAVWRTRAANGNIGIPYRYCRIGEDGVIDLSRVYTVARSGSGNGLSLALPESRDISEVNDGRGRYIAAAAWEEFRANNIYEGHIAVKGKDGQIGLFKRTHHTANELKKRKAETFRGAALKTVLSRLKKEKTAFCEIELVDFTETTLPRGLYIPYVEEGDVIELVSAGGRNPGLLEKKMKNGRLAQEVLGVGIIRQELARGFGNVWAGAVVGPMNILIEDVETFAVRPQNELILRIAGIQSYGNYSIVSFDAEGRLVCYGSIEGTNPDVVPERLGNDAEAKRIHDQLIEQFGVARDFAKIVANGIMGKINREELSVIVRQFLGRKLYAALKAREFDALKGRKFEEATVMYADISGFTAMTEKLSEVPEQVFEMLNNLWEIMEPIVDKYDGLTDKYIGDCLMAAWGVPNPDGAGVESSLTAVIEMQRELHKLNSTPEMKRFYEENGVPELGLSIGVNTGPLIAGTIGSKGGKRDYSVIGGTVNAGARIEGAAKGGQIQIGEGTYSKLSETFKQKYLDNFNEYNTGEQTQLAIRRAIVAKLEESGQDTGQTREILKNYYELYRNATEADIFTQGGIIAKGIGTMTTYWVQWDRHAYRDRFLQQAFERVGLVWPEEPAAEKAPDPETKIREAFETLAALGVDRQQQGLVLRILREVAAGAGGGASKSVSISPPNRD